MLRRLLPLARDGLNRWGVAQAHIDRLLGIIDSSAALDELLPRGRSPRLASLSEHNGADRSEALRLMTQRYIEHMHANEPVHTWPDSP